MEKDNYTLFIQILIGEIRNILTFSRTNIDSALKE